MQITEPVGPSLEEAPTALDADAAGAAAPAGVKGSGASGVAGGNERCDELRRRPCQTVAGSKAGGEGGGGNANVAAGIVPAAVSMR